MFASGGFSRRECRFLSIKQRTAIVDPGFSSPRPFTFRRFQWHRNRQFSLLSTDANRDLARVWSNRDDEPLWNWVLRFGGPGLIVIGLIDNSAIPIPGGMDVSVILLTAHHPTWWPYYGAMATTGAVIGGYLTYRVARKGGKAGLEKKIGRRRAEKIYKQFEKGGFSTVFIGSILPPPLPMVPVLMAAGVMQYARKRFLVALSLGRGIRFFMIAFLAHVYGTATVGWLGRYYKPLLYILISLAVAGAIGAFLYFKWYHHRHRPQRDVQQRRAA